jgi:hypothetical protein
MKINALTALGALSFMLAVTVLFANSKNLHEPNPESRLFLGNFEALCNGPFTSARVDFQNHNPGLTLSMFASGRNARAQAHIENVSGVFFKSIEARCTNVLPSPAFLRLEVTFIPPGGAQQKSLFSFVKAVGDSNGAAMLIVTPDSTSGADKKIPVNSVLSDVTFRLQTDVQGVSVANIESAKVNGTPVEFNGDVSASCAN